MSLGKFVEYETCRATPLALCFLKHGFLCLNEVTGKACHLSNALEVEVEEEEVEQCNMFPISSAFIS